MAQTLDRTVRCQSFDMRFGLGMFNGGNLNPIRAHQGHLPDVDRYVCRRAVVHRSTQLVIAKDRRLLQRVKRRFLRKQSCRPNHPIRLGFDKEVTGQFTRMRLSDLRSRYAVMSQLVASRSRFMEVFLDAPQLLLSREDQYARSKCDKPLLVTSQSCSFSMLMRAPKRAERGNFMAFPQPFCSAGPISHQSQAHCRRRWRSPILAHSRLQISP